MRASLQTSVAVAGAHPAIPKAERMAIKIWNMVGGIVMIGGIVYAFFGGWYWAVVGVVVGVLIVQANHRNAANIVTETALANPAFKAEMLRRGIIIES